MQDAVVVEKGSIQIIMTTGLRSSGSYRICSLCGVFFLFLGVVEVEGKTTPSSEANPIMGSSSVEDKSRQPDVNRRDPFKRIKKKQLPSSLVSKNSHPLSTIVPQVEDPNWKLLGVMHSQSGHQAVIQISPQERVLVQPGSKLARSGWTIKTITEGEVFLEHLFSTSSVGVSSRPRTFILAFPPIRKSP